MNFALLFIAMSTWTTSATDMSLDTDLGPLKGWTGLSRNGREYSAFTKIPFAKAPVGNLRFTNPVPFGKWSGVLDATGDIPVCYQFDALNISGTQGSRTLGSEDCLYLNVYVPKGVSEKLPVLFYIHGGGFRMGYPGGRHMARFVMDEDVILVAATYRLSFFGFLSMEDATIPGNFGLKDQALALKWVKDNIRSFGGDSERIVIFGESAGGASAHHLLLSPLTKDLISGAVSSSGVVGVWGLARPGSVKKASLALTSMVGCEGKDDVLACLQSVQTDAWKSPLTDPTLGGLQFQPCVEPDASGAVIPTNPLNSIPKAPWITSFTDGEYLLFSSGPRDKPPGKPLNFTAMVQSLINKLGVDISSEEKINEIVKQIETKYKEDNESLPEHILPRIGADYSFTFSAIDALNRQSGKKYFYVFEHRGQINMVDIISPKNNVKTACHADELIYLFDMNPRANNTFMNEVDLKVSKDYIKLLTNFAHTQNPTPEGSPVEWKPWETNEVLRITSKGNMMGGTEYYGKFDDVYKFWKEILAMSRKN